jgi:hypothetical protein
VSVLEAAWVLETERTIDADVREPGEGNLNRSSAIGQHADRAQNERKAAVWARL